MRLQPEHPSRLAFGKGALINTDLIHPAVLPGAAWAGSRGTRWIGACLASPNPSPALPALPPIRAVLAGGGWHRGFARLCCAGGGQAAARVHRRPRSRSTKARDLAGIPLSWLGSSLICTDLCCGRQPR